MIMLMHLVPLLVVYMLRHASTICRFFIILDIPTCIWSCKSLGKMIFNSDGSDPENSGFLGQKIAWLSMLVICGLRALDS